MSKSPYIYVFLKDETGTSISLISLFSTVPTKQIYKPIADKIKLQKNKVIELKYKGELLDENLSLSTQNIAPYSDLHVFVKDEQINIENERKSTKHHKSNSGAGDNFFNVHTTSTSIKNNAANAPGGTMKNIQTAAPTESNPIFVAPLVIPNFTRRNIAEVADLASVIEESVATPANFNNIKSISPSLSIDKSSFESLKAQESKLLCNIKKIQNFFRKRKFQKIYQIKQKKLKYRKYVIEEIISSEEKYMNSLNCVINYYILPARQKGLISKNEEDRLFGYIENIALFSEKLHSSLFAVLKNNFLRNQTKIADIFLKMMPFFKLYIPYLNNYDLSIQLLEKLRKNPKIAAFLKEREFTTESELQDLSSMLIKPIQRLPKYVLLFKDLKKNTEEIHPDYNNICDALSGIEQMNKEYNSGMRQYLKKNKIFELQDKFGSSTFIILDPQREFVEEEAVSIIIKDFPRTAICYFLTDMLLISERVFEAWKLIKYIHLDRNSTVRDMPDTRYFSHIFTVYGVEEGLILSADSSENKAKLMKMINEIIKQLINRSDSKIKTIQRYSKQDIFEIKKNFVSCPVIIKVIGTTKRGLKDIKPFFVYIILITLNKIQQRLYIRYSDFLKLDEIIKKDFPQIKISHFPSKKIFSNNQAIKTIESRKLQIEAFLQSVLKSDEIINSNHPSRDKILNFLGLPRNFYEISENQQTTNSLKENEGKVLRELKEKLSVFKVLKSLTQNIRRIESTDYTSNLEFEEMIVFTREIEVALPNGSLITTRINKTTKAIEVCQEISDKLNLVSYLDYKLFVVFNSNKEERLIQDDEFLYKVFETDLSETLTEAPDLFTDDGSDARVAQSSKYRSFSTTPKGLMSNMKTKVRELYNNVKKKTKVLFNNECRIMYKKYLFLEENLEMVDYQIDEVKLEMLCDQLFSEIYNLNYVISLNDYALFSAIMSYLKNGSLNNVKPSDFLNFMKEESLKQFIPNSVYEKKDKDFWINNIGAYWKKFSEEFEKTADKNRIVNDENNAALLRSLRMPHKSIKYSKETKPVDNKIIARLVFINCLKKTSLYGCQLFRMEFESYPLDEKFPKQVWIAVSYYGLKILNEKKIELKRIEFSQIIKSISFPNCYELTIDARSPELKQEEEQLGVKEKIEKMEKKIKNKLEAKNETNINDKNLKENNNANEIKINVYKFELPDSYEIWEMVETYIFLRELLKNNKEKILENMYVKNVENLASKLKNIEEIS